MKAKLSKITGDVAALLNQSLALKCEPEELPIPDFAFRVALLAPGLLADILRESPRVMLSGWRPLAGELKIDASGMATLKLPDDFFLPGTIRLAGWSRSVDRLLHEDDPERRLQASPVEGVRGCRQRPVAFLDIADDGGKCLRMFSATPGDTLEEGWYLPFPAIDGDALEVPPALYHELVKSLAERIGRS